MMPYLRSVLRETVGKGEQEFRLGNLYCVSAKRGWWTKSLKEDIWRRGGGGWMVGKVNVGKSSLYEAVFPKGRSSGEGKEQKVQSIPETFHDHSTGLLPPTPLESPYPCMPMISHFPGTTAAPIRNVFGDRKGELIDLPGIPRGGLQEYMDERHRRHLPMRQRVQEKACSLRPGESLVVSNLIRITPVATSCTFQVYPFMTLPFDVVKTETAEAVPSQHALQPYAATATPAMMATMTSAGLFSLSWDVTRERSGPLTRKDGIGLDPRALPFAILSCDLVLEGLGWIEVSAQVRRKTLVDTLQVEAFSPHGRHIALRKPLISYRHTEVAKF